MPKQKHRRAYAQPREDGVIATSPQIAVGNLLGIQVLVILGQRGHGHDRENYQPGLCKVSPRAHAKTHKTSNKIKCSQNAGLNPIPAKPVVAFSAAEFEPM